MLTSSTDVAAAVAKLSGPLITSSAPEGPAASPEGAADATPPSADTAPATETPMPGDGDGEGPTAAEQDGPAGGDGTADATEGEGKEEGKKDGPNAKAWAALYRKEKALRDRDASFRAREARLQQLEQRAQQAIELQQEFEKDPYAFVEKKGFDYDAWARRKLAGGAPDPIHKVSEAERKIAELQQRLDAQQQEAETRAMEARAQQWVASAHDVLKDPKYSLVRDYPGGEDAVARVAAITLREQGKWLTPREAADIIAQELDTRISILEKKKHIARPTQATPAAPQSPHVTTGQSKEKSSDTLTTPDEDILRSGSRRQKIQVLAKRLRWK